MQGSKGCLSWWRVLSWIFSLVLFLLLPFKVWGGALRPEPGCARFQGGRFVQQLGSKQKLIYSFDPVLQQYTLKKMRRYRLRLGAAVAVVPQTGRVLVMAGYSRKTPRGCLLPQQSDFPAASVFKIVTTAALLQRGVSLKKRVCYHGGLRGIKARHLRPSRRDHRCLTLALALGKSANVAMGRLAVRYLPPAFLQQVARNFGFGEGFGQYLGITDSEALIPRDPLNLARTAAGFGHVFLSPFLAAFFTAAIANKGLMPAPRLLASSTPPKLARRFPAGKAVRVLSKRVARLLTRAMIHTTVRGTARRYFRRRPSWFPRSIRVAGKTGSLADKKPEYIEYTWFVGFAPAHQPKIAVAALIGNNPLWHIKASQLAYFILQRYFRLHPEARPQRKRRRKRRRSRKRRKRGRRR